jgi:hypothetical protein
LFLISVISGQPCFFPTLAYWTAFFFSGFFFWGIIKTRITLTTGLGNYFKPWVGKCQGFCGIFYSLKKKKQLIKNTAKPEGLDLDCVLAWLTLPEPVLRW